MKGYELKNPRKGGEQQTLLVSNWCSMCPKYWQTVVAICAGVIWQFWIAVARVEFSIKGKGCNALVPTVHMSTWPQQKLWIYPLMTETAMVLIAQRRTPEVVVTGEPTINRIECHALWQKSYLKFEIRSIPSKLASHLEECHAKDRRWKAFLFHISHGFKGSHVRSGRWRGNEPGLI